MLGFIFYSDAVIAFMLFFPMLVGMVCAFLAGKKSGSIGSSQVDSIWHGYGKGMASCCMTIISMGTLFTLLVSFVEFGAFLGIIAFGIAATFFYMIFVGLAGLILFTMPAFFGFGIGRQTYAAIMIELEAKKSAEQLAEEIKRKESAKPHLT